MLYQLSYARVGAFILPAASRAFPAQQDGYRVRRLPGARDEEPPPRGQLNRGRVLAHECHTGDAHHRVLELLHHEAVRGLLSVTAIVYLPALRLVTLLPL